MKSIYLLLVLSTVIFSCSNKFEIKPKTVAYIKYNSIKFFEPEIFNHVDVLIYKLIRPKEDGSLELLSTTLKDLKLLNNHKKKHTHIPLLLGVGGANKNSEHFSKLAASKEYRAVFTENLIGFCKSNNLQGIDLDWEYPKSDFDKKNAVLLFQKMSKELKKKKLLFTAAFNYSRDQTKFIMEVVSFVDQVHLMTYEPLKEVVLKNYQDQFDYAVSNVANEKLPKEKVVLGVPFYGRSKSKNKFLKYKEIVTNYQPEYELDSVNSYQFMNIKSIIKNTLFVKENGWGGILFWELGFDMPIRDSRSLLRAISNTMKESAKVNGK